MKHASSLDVFAHWNDRRGRNVAPFRADIDPGAIRHSLGDVFMLSVDFGGEFRFRLAGTRICALFRRELKNEPFDKIWSEASRDQITRLMTIIAKDEVGAVAGVTGTTADNTAIELELLLLPMARQGHARLRALGVLAPIQVPFWIGVKALTQLELGSIRHLGAVDRRTGTPRFVAAAGGRIKKGFVVHDGGKIEPDNDDAQEKAS
ncbi:MAG: PAS domain-containing protein [Pseudolabrys sp.]